MNDIDDITRRLARVEPGAEGGSASDAGARALLTAITASPPEQAPTASTRGRRMRRLALGLAGAGLAATALVVGPGLLEDGGSPSYAVTKSADGIVYVKLRDFRDAAGLSRQLRDLGVPALVDYAPPGQWCREPRGTHVQDIPRGLYSVPENIPGETEGWQMRIDTRLFKPDQTFVWTISDHGTSTILMTGPVAPCELAPQPEVTVARPPWRPVDEPGLAGRTIAQVLPGLRERGLTVRFLIVDVPEGNPGGYGEVETRRTSPGDGWYVWGLDRSTTKDGLVRLIVTPTRYDRNPVDGEPVN